jgi:hypothetical protein
VSRIGVDEEADGMVEGWPVFFSLRFFSLLLILFFLGSSHLYLHLPPHTSTSPTLSLFTKFDTPSLPTPLPCLDPDFLSLLPCS